MIILSNRQKEMAWGVKKVHVLWQLSALSPAAQAARNTQPSLNPIRRFLRRGSPGSLDVSLSCHRFSCSARFMRAEFDLDSSDIVTLCHVTHTTKPPLCHCSLIYNYNRVAYHCFDGQHDLLTKREKNSIRSLPGNQLFVYFLTLYCQIGKPGCVWSRRRQTHLAARCELHIINLIQRILGYRGRFLTDEMWWKCLFFSYLFLFLSLSKVIRPFVW